MTTGDPICSKCGCYVSLTPQPHVCNTQDLEDAKRAAQELFERANMLQVLSTKQFHSLCPSCLRPTYVDEPHACPIPYGNIVDPHQFWECPFCKQHISQWQYHDCKPRQYTYTTGTPQKKPTVTIQLQPNNGDCAKTFKEVVDYKWNDAGTVFIFTHDGREIHWPRESIRTLHVIPDKGTK